MKELHQQFVQLGKQRHKLLNELLAILPEIYESRIYKKYACSIFEYAAKFGGIPKSTVEKRLRLEKYLKDKPKLKEAMVEVGVGKVALVATLTTPENEEQMVDKLKNMSKAAVQVMTKELRNHTEPVKTKVELDEDITFMLEKLIKAQKEKKGKQEFIRELIQKAYTEEFGKEDEKIEQAEEKVILGDNSGERSRYISKNEQRVALKKTQGRCAHCHKPKDLFHHCIPYSNSRNHESIIPLCKEHHEILHSGQSEVDKLYHKYRQESLL